MYRVYYNQRSDWPKIWSVDAGDQKSEITVRAVVMDQCRVVTRCLIQPGNPEPLNVFENPIAWLEVDGTLEVLEDIALFRR